MESSLFVAGLNPSSEQFSNFQMGRKDNLHIPKWGFKHKLTTFAQGLDKQSLPYTIWTTPSFILFANGWDYFKPRRCINIQ